MKKKHINNALKDVVIAGLPQLYQTFPNVDAQGNPVRPYLEVAFPDIVVRTGSALKGNRVREVARMVVTVVVEEGTNEDAANDHADAVADLFPQGMQLAIPAGKITIQQPAEIRGGFRDTPDWRVPVVIRYTASNA